MTTTRQQWNGTGLPPGAEPVSDEQMTDLQVWPDGDPRKSWTAGEMAALLRVPKITIYEMRKAGQLGAAKVGRYYRFPDTELVRLLRDAAHAVKPAA